MTTRPSIVVIDAKDPVGLGRFWAALLGWEVTYEQADEVVVEVEEGAPAWGDGGAPALVFVPVDEPKRGKNRVHLDLASDSPDDQRARVARALDLGAREADIGQRDVSWVVLADPEGNEFCVLAPNERYRGALGIAAVLIDSEDPGAIAPYWEAATGWTAELLQPGFVSLRQPQGGGTAIELLKVPEAKQGKNRLHVDVAPPAGGDLADEVGRLEQAGATRLDIGQGEVSWVVLADPEGNEHCVLTPR